MKRIVFLIIVVLFFASCTPVPSFLDGHILKDMDTGRVFKVVTLVGIKERMVAEDGTVYYMDANSNYQKVSRDKK